MIQTQIIKTRIKSVYQKLRRRVDRERETALLLLGKQMAWQVAALPPNTDFRRVGFKVFSQWDEDGIIQYLISHVPIENRTFIEFGVENYEESNTRFLLLNNHWQGMVLDACASDIEYIRSDRIHWQYDLQVKKAWITRENIDSLVAEAGFGKDLGLLSIDLNGNDCWIWEAIESVRPRIAIVEYNSLLGLEPDFGALPGRFRPHRGSSFEFVLRQFACGAASAGSKQRLHSSGVEYLGPQRFFRKV